MCYNKLNTYVEVFTVETGKVIDLSILRDNVRAIRSVVPESAMLLAVVKADAYGHGAVQVARAAIEAGAGWLAVALLQ